MAVLDPEWTEPLDTAGRPRDPLGSTRARNQIVDLYAHGLITENPFRMRYFSLFAWILDAIAQERVKIEEHSEDVLIKRFEKIVALSSRYHALVEDHPTEALRAVSGVLELRRISREDLDVVDLDGFELQQNDGYGYQNYERAMQKFLLKRGGYQLTNAGEEVAAAASRSVEPVARQVFDCVRSGTVTRDDFEYFTRPLAIQSVHWYPDEFGEELDALQKVLGGNLDWEGGALDGSTRLAAIPDTFDTTFLHYLYESLPTGTTDQEAGGTTVADDPASIESIAYENYHQHLHDFRRNSVLFFLLSWTYYQEDSDKVSLSGAQVKAFEDTTNLFLLYWLQIYAGYAIDAQLEAVTTFVNKFDPPRYPLDELLSVPASSVIDQAATTVLTSLTTNWRDAPVTPKSFTRHLLLYNEAIDSKLQVEVDSGASPRSGPGFGELRQLARETSAPPHHLESVNEVTIAKSIRMALDDLHESEPATAPEPWARAVGRSLALLSYIDARVTRMQETNPNLYRLLRHQLGTQPGNSLRVVHDYLSTIDLAMPIHEMGKLLIKDRVIQVHEDVMYSRLTPGNLQRLFSLDRDEAVCLRIDRDPHKRPYKATPRFIRFDELSTLIRDCGLLNGSQSDGYEITPAGRDLLARACPVTPSPNEGGENG